MGSPQQPNGTDVALSGNTSPDNVSQDQFSSRSANDDQVFEASLRGRELIYRGACGRSGMGSGKSDPVDYGHLGICGCAFQRAGLADQPGAEPYACRLPVVHTETEYGWDRKVRMALPVFTGAAGSSQGGQRDWEHFAVGAALAGITWSCSASLCRVDPGLERSAEGKVTRAPDLDRRVALYKRYHRDEGEMLVQVNGDDLRSGVAEYVIDRHGLDTIELHLGRGAGAPNCQQGLPQTKDESGPDLSRIGSRHNEAPGMVDSLEQALQLRNRGCLVTPDPLDPIVQSACEEGVIRRFQYHSRLGFVEEDCFYAECDRLRGLGFRRIAVKMRVCGPRELAMAMKWSSKARIDLLTIDGGSEDSRVAPGRMLWNWGLPAIYLHSAAAEFAAKMAAKGRPVPDMAFAGGFSTEDQLFKCLALASPAVKAVCMGRAMITSAAAGKDIARWLKEGKLPPSVSRFGSTPEEIFVCWQQVADLVGRTEMPRIPLGAVGIYSYVNKLQTGLEQLMAGAGCFHLAAISRRDLVSLTRECAEVTGIPCAMDSCREQAEAILD